MAFDVGEKKEEKQQNLNNIETQELESFWMTEIVKQGLSCSMNEILDFSSQIFGKMTDDKKNKIKFVLQNQMSLCKKFDKCQISTFFHVNLSDNEQHFGKVGTKWLADILASNESKISCIKISNCHLDNDCLQMLCRLKGNLSRIEEVTISANKGITDDGLKMLFETMSKYCVKLNFCNMSRLSNISVKCIVYINDFFTTFEKQHQKKARMMIIAAQCKDVNKQSIQKHIYKKEWIKNFFLTENEDDWF